jgi:hypothetical protein
MGVLFVLCGILAGFAVYRWGEARATWRRVKDGRTSVRGYRTSAWRHTRFAVLYVAGAILLLFFVANVLK